MTSSTAFNFALPESNGIAPKSRVPTSNDAYCIADQLRRDNAIRERRWSAVYKCYKRFPPTEYSELAKKQLFGLSNVPYGQMTMDVDDKKSAFIDMVTDRNVSARIITKIGNEKERHEWSELISEKWDKSLWRWDSYFYNIDQDLESMLLFGKGIEIKDEKAAWQTRPYQIGQILIPDDTKANLENLGEMVIRDQYTPLEFWNKFKNSKDNPSTGWNFWACLDALRYHTQFTDYRMSMTQYLRKITEGNVSFARYFNVKIPVYIMFVKEYGGKISKYVFLQTYSTIAGARRMKEDQYMDQAGYLFQKQDYESDWNDMIFPFHGAAGSGKWHDIKGYAEDIFPAARQYDITMNKVIDGVDMEMMVPIKGVSADATDKLKKMEWGRMFVMPEEVDYAQRGFQLPIADAINATQVIMQDTYRGLANYGQVRRSGNQTARESELNFAQEAKLDGTQLRRYNICHTRWQRGMYRQFVKAKSGWKGYEIYEKFAEELKSEGVPEEAWQWENIDTFNSMMLPGAGSPANKVITAQRLSVVAGASAITEGQENAYRDEIAALAGRENVDLYRPKKKMDVPDQARVIAFENSVLNNPNANAENARVFPTDNHYEHIRGHFSDCMISSDQAMQQIKAGAWDAEDARNAVTSLMLKGGHIMAHMQMLALDQSKQNIVKQFGQSMEELKGRVDELTSIADEMTKAEQNNNPTQSEDEQKLQLKIAEKAIDLKAKQDAAQQKLAINATKAAATLEQRKQAAATEIAIKRAQAKQKSGGPVPE